MIIDAHSHYMPPAVAENTIFFKEFWSDFNRHLKLMDEFHIEKAVLLYPTSDAHLKMGGWLNLCRVYNQEISELVKKFPDRFIGGGIIPADEPDLIPVELNRIENLGLKVISLASSYNAKYLDDEIFFPVYEFAQKKNIPVHVHPQIMNPIGEERLRDPLLSPVLEYVFDVSVAIGRMMMGGIFQRFPEVKFIFAHYGGVLPIVKERFDTTYQMLRKRNFVKDINQLPSDYFKNLYFDTSGSKSVASLRLALELTDAEHILWGSDFPANQNLIQSLEMIQLTNISDRDREKIFEINFNCLIAKIPTENAKI